MFSVQTTAVKKEGKSLGSFFVVVCLLFFFGGGGGVQSGVHYFRQCGTASGYSYRVDFK